MKSSTARAFADAVAYEARRSVRDPLLHLASSLEDDGNVLLRLGAIRGIGRDAPFASRVFLASEVAALARASKAAAVDMLYPVWCDLIREVMPEGWRPPAHWLPAPMNPPKPRWWRLLRRPG